MVLASSLSALNWQKLFIGCIVMALYTLVLQGQNNPFEISSRKAAKADSSATGTAQALNPFELIKARADASNSTVLVRDHWKQEIDRLLNIRSDPQQVRSMLFWFLLFLTFMLAIAVNLNRGLVAKLYRTSFNLNLFNILYRDSREESRLIFPLLYGLYFAGLSIFVYLSLIVFKQSNYSMLLIVLAAAVMLVYLVRHLSLRLLASVFKIGKEVDHYLFNIICFGSLMAIILIPLDFVIAFSREEWARKLIILGAVFLMLVYLFRQLKEILASSNLWSRSIFHFLLYLCAFEFAPLVFLVVYIHRQGWV